MNDNKFLHNEISFDLLAVILPAKRESDLRSALKNIPGFAFLQLHGVGTANSTVLEILGLDDNSMLMAMLSVCHKDAQKSLLYLGEVLHLFEPGNGIAFVLPMERCLGLLSLYEALNQPKAKPLLSKWSKLKSRLSPRKQKSESLENFVNNENCPILFTDQELILAILNEDHAHEAIHQMRSLGVRGGTILPASGRAKHQEGHFLGMELVPEKEILLMVVPAQRSASILEHLYVHGELAMPGSGIAFSLPLSWAIGLSFVEATKEESVVE